MTTLRAAIEAIARSPLASSPGWLSRRHGSDGGSSPTARCEPACACSLASEVSYNSLTIELQLNPRASPRSRPAQSREWAILETRPAPRAFFFRCAHCWLCSSTPIWFSVSVPGPCSSWHGVADRCVLPRGVLTKMWTASGGGANNTRPRCSQHSIADGLSAVQARARNDQVQIWMRTCCAPVSTMCTAVRLDSLGKDQHP